MGLVLSNSNFFINKNSQGRKSVREKSTYSLEFGFKDTVFLVAIPWCFFFMYKKTTLFTKKEIIILVLKKDKKNNLRVA